MTEQTWKLSKRAHLEGTKQKAGGVLFDTYTATMYSCNPTAWTTLEGLREENNLANLSRRLCKRFNVKKEQAEGDVLALVNQLIAMDLVNAVKPKETARRDNRVRRVG